MSDHNLNANVRKDEGKGASRRLRHAGQVPAIIYGGKEAPESIQIEHNHLWHISQSEWFYAAILSLNVGGKVQQVLLRDMQRHPYKQLIMHLDFQRVDENEAIHFNVPLHFLNQEKSPAGKTANVIVTHELHELSIVCLPRDLPEFIEVDLAKLEMGQSVHLSQIKLAKGVEFVQLAHDNDATIASIAKTRGGVADDAADETAETPAA